MTFDVKKAVESWKKAKPLMLTDTGISDFLRKLPADAASKTYLADLAKARPKLQAFMNDAKIKTEKKALACLKQIDADIAQYIAGIEANRKHVLGSMEKVLAGTKAYFVEAIKSPTVPRLVERWSDGVAQAERGARFDPREHPDDPQLAALVGDWYTTGSVQEGAHTSIVKLIEFHKEKPMPDFNAQLVRKIKDFGDVRSSMEEIRNAVAKLAA